MGDVLLDAEAERPFRDHTESVTVDDCLVCKELDGSIDLPGGFLWEDAQVVAFHIPPLPDRSPRPFLGHLLVVTRRHVARFGDLTAEEGAAVGRAAARLSRALTDGAGAEWVYSAVIGRGVPHFHLHLMPRYPGTPVDLPWYEQWEAGPHGAAAEVAELAEKLRGDLGADMKLTEFRDTWASKKSGGGQPGDGKRTIQGSSAASRDYPARRGGYRQRRDDVPLLRNLPTHLLPLAASL